MTTTFYAQDWVENPDLVPDLKTFFFPDLTEEEVKKLIEEYGVKKLTVISDRFEFINKLEELKQIFLQKRVLHSPDLTWIEVNGERLLKFEQLESIELEGKEFNGITFDIDALIQYLLLTSIDTVLGGGKYKNFPDWLDANCRSESMTISEVRQLHDLYMAEHGLRRMFLLGFDALSSGLKKQLTDAFLLVKLDNGKLNEKSYENWQKLEPDVKFKQLAKFLYDHVRCQYTHESSRHFLPYKNVTSRRATEKAILISCVNPDDLNLIELLKKVVIELTRKEFKVSEVT